MTIRPCSFCGTRRKAAKTARCKKHRTQHVGYHHTAIKGTGKYDSLHRPTDLPAHVIDAIFLREQRKKRPAWSLCR